jgi:RNA polymerase sigma factor (sigma-70 family)
MLNDSLTHGLASLQLFVAARVALQVPDEELLSRFVAGDEGAFGALLQRHSGMVLSVCRRVLRSSHDAEDAFQATFLTLAQRATRIRKRSAVGSWLHGTAFRIAAGLRAGRLRRRAQPLPPDLAARPADEARAEAWQELLTALDEELARLPECYRAPLVHCYLEGQTRDEAAAQLGWTVGMVRGRLARGRELLRGRLARRGLAVPVALLAAGLGAAESGAAPPHLVVLTLRSARKVVGGSVAAAGLSAPVAALLQRGVPRMMLSRKKSCCS